MDKDRVLASLHVYKNTIYLCIMDHSDAIIFEKRMRVLNKW